MKAPSVGIRADGMNGYIVVLTDLDGKPVELRRFEIPANAGGVTVAGTTPRARIAKEQAQAYRDGVAEGIYRASRFLSDLIGATS